MSKRKETPTGDYLDPKSFGALVDLNRESIYRAIERGELRAIRIGRAIRCKRSINPVSVSAWRRPGTDHDPG